MNIVMWPLFGVRILLSPNTWTFGVRARAYPELRMIGVRGRAYPKLRMIGIRARAYPEVSILWTICIAVVHVVARNCTYNIAPGRDHVCYVLNLYTLSIHTI